MAWRRLEMLTSLTLEAKVNTWMKSKAFKLEIKPPSVKPPPPYGGLETWGERVGLVMILSKLLDEF